MATGLLNLSIIDIPVWIILCCMCSVHYRMFSSIPVLFLLDVSSIASQVWQPKTCPDIVKWSLGLQGGVAGIGEPGGMRWCDKIILSLEPLDWRDGSVMKWEPTTDRLYPHLSTRGLPRPHYGSNLENTGLWPLPNRLWWLGGRWQQRCTKESIWSISSAEEFQINYPAIPL